MITTLLSLKKPQIEAHIPQIVSIYRHAFSAAPYNKPEAEIQNFAKTMPTQFEREDYRFIGAFNEPGVLVGFSYGYSTRAGRWWCQAVEPSLTKQAAAYWLDGSFQLVELAVDPEFQGRGIGGKLHDHILLGLKNERVTLSTMQAETVAHRLYEKRGWVVLLENFFFPSVKRRYQIMGLELKRQGAANSPAKEVS